MSEQFDSISSSDLMDLSKLINEKILSGRNYDEIQVQDTQDPDWGMKSVYIQMSLFNMGLTADSIVADTNKTALVSYSYPEDSEFDTCLFFTTKEPDDHMVLGFPGTATADVGDRVYFGLMVWKGGAKELRYSYGNRLFQEIRKTLYNASIEESEFVSSLLDFWLPNKH